MRFGLLLAVLLLAACSGPGSPPSPTTSPATTGPAATPTPTAGAGLRVLASELSLPNQPFAVAAATDADQYASLWSSLNQSAPVPAVDFGTELVLFLGISGSSSCPERFERLIVDEPSGRVYAEWTLTENRACTDDLAPQGILVAVDRSALPAEPFMLSLRSQLICSDCPDHPDRQLVDPVR